MTPIVENLVDTIWGESKPKMPANPVFVLDTKYSGKSVADKYAQIESKLDPSVDVLFTTTLDEVAWFLNLRGSDIEYNPVFFAYLLFFPTKTDTHKHKVHLFINADKV